MRNGDSLPDKARAVIIGGGVMGCSLAYHLTKLGWRDIVLLERKQLTSGTTWHAAGLIPQFRQTLNMTRMAKYSQELYGTLEQETGISTGFVRNGSINVALTKERWEEFRRGAAMARYLGVDVEELSPSEVRDRYPLLNLDGIVAGVYLPTDGKGDPTNITMSLAKGARMGGARVFEQTNVTAIHKSQGRVIGVTTDRGRIEADVVVNCAGMWARDVGKLAGVSVSLHACEHFYVVTEPMENLPKDLPTLRVPDECTYFKEDASKLLIGAFEPNAKPWGMNGIPEDFCFDQIPEDIDHFAPILEAAVRRLPALETAGIHTFFNGPESFTPDARYLVGEAPELRNFFVAAGFNSDGVHTAGGIGEALAAWIDAGEPPFDLWDIDIRRMQPFQNNRSYLYRRSSEALGLRYADHFPYRQHETARGIRKSPFHNQLTDMGACFGEVAGWERPNWFQPPEDRWPTASRYEYSWGRQNWFDYARREHLAVRERAGLFDLTSFGKILVEGRDAEAVLQRVCANDVAVPEGKIVYGQWLNSRGGVEADLTVTRLSETAFIVITAGATLVRDLTWLRRHVPEGADCFIVDVSSSEAVLAVMGPDARLILEQHTPHSLANEDFPFGIALEIEFGSCMVRAHRLSYVGELGWELYMPTEMADHVFTTLWSGELTPTPCGMHVLDSCRIEKAYRHFGHDITDEDHILEAGLGFAVKQDKKPSAYGDFIGRQAVLETRASGLRRRLVQFMLSEPEPLLYHNEPIYRDGEPAGYITSGNYGHFLGAAIGLGYVNCSAEEKAADVLSSVYEIDVAGTHVEATASLKPLYDPKSQRVAM